MNTGRVVAETPGESARTLLEYTPSELLVRKPEGPHASVTMTVGRSFGYGDLKVSASVTLQCDQNEETVEEAGKRAFLKAVELMNDGISVMSQVLESEKNA